MAEYNEIRKKDSADASTNIEEADIFEHHLNSYDRSKTVKVLNMIYSLIVGILSSKTTKKFFKYHRALGIALACLSYIAGRKFLKINIEKPIDSSD